MEKLYEEERRKFEDASAEIQKHEKNAEKVKNELEKARIYRNELESVRRGKGIVSYINISVIFSSENFSVLILHGPPISKLQGAFRI